MKLSVVIPAYNEAEIVKDTVQQLCSFLQTHYGDEAQAIFCDDGSTDGTRAILETLCPQYPNLKVVGYGENRGKGAAVRHGMLSADGDFILFTDCDLAYGLQAISDLYSHFLAHPTADAVIGTRLADKDALASYSFFRKWMSRTYRRFVALVTKTRFHDTQTGLKGFTKEVVQKICPLCEIDRFAFDLELLLWCEHFSFAVLEYPVRILQNRTAQSKVHPFRDAWRMTRDVFQIRRRLKKHPKRSS